MVISIRDARLKSELGLKVSIWAVSPFLGRSGSGGREAPNSDTTPCCFSNLNGSFHFGSVLSTAGNVSIATTRTTRTPTIAFGWSSRPRPGNRLQATSQPKNSGEMPLKGDARSEHGLLPCSKEQRTDPPNCGKTQCRLSPSPKNKVKQYMNQQYSDYLKSEAWKLKRKARLELSGYRCSVCHRKNSLHVHHLTYARIFNEDMADLMPLCDTHHETAEMLVAQDKISRKGSPLWLATETIRLIRWWATSILSYRGQTALTYLSHQFPRKSHLLIWENSIHNSPDK